MPTRYSPAFRTMMIQKMTDPDRPSAVSIANDIGVSISTLSFKQPASQETTKMVLLTGLHIGAISCL
jgi:hypothetical protein